MNGSDFFDQQPDGRGGYSGPRLQGPLFIPAGFGLVFTDLRGRRWQLGLALNADGTQYYGDDGKPTLELNEVTL